MRPHERERLLRDQRSAMAAQAQQLQAAVAGLDDMLKDVKTQRSGCPFAPRRIDRAS